MEKNVALQYRDLAKALYYCIQKSFTLDLFTSMYRVKETCKAWRSEKVYNIITRSTNSKYLKEVEIS